MASSVRQGHRRHPIRPVPRMGEPGYPVRLRRPGQQVDQPQHLGEVHRRAQALGRLPARDDRPPEHAPSREDAEQSGQPGRGPHSVHRLQGVRVAHRLVVRQLLRQRAEPVQAVRIRVHPAYLGQQDSYGRAAVRQLQLHPQRPVKPGGRHAQDVHGNRRSEPVAWRTWKSVRGRAAC